MQSEKYKTSFFQKLERLDFYFEDINEIISCENVGSRVRLMLRDLVNLRKNGWKPAAEN